MTDRLTSLLAERPWLLADGATGSNLFERGLTSGDAPELWNYEHPERIAQLQRADPEREVSVSSNRAGAHPGTHEIGFDSVADSLTIRHTARSREGFARGALLAARWVAGKQGWFEFRDVLFNPDASQAASSRKAGASQPHDDRESL